MSRSFRSMQKNPALVKLSVGGADQNNLARNVDTDSVETPRKMAGLVAVHPLTGFPLMIETRLVGPGEHSGEIIVSLYTNMVKIRGHFPNSGQKSPFGYLAG